MIDTAADEAEAAALRQGLVDRLVDAGSISSKEVEAAFRRVPRHRFAPEVRLEEAYADDVVRTKRDADGATISSVSAPWLQAAMLEQAAIAPGMRCLEVGSGGYNAALMAELAGPTGQVTTVDIDADVTERARRCLAEAGYERVEVVLGDAEHGVAGRAPYDRVVVTVGVWDVPVAWVDQLSAGGRLVVPLRLRGLSRSVALVRDGDHLVSTGHVMAGFVPLQGAGARAHQLVPLHGDEVGLRFDEDPAVDADALGAALRQPRVPAWSGVRFGGSEPFDGLFLWLATTFAEFGLLWRDRSETARELVDPASAIGTPALLGQDGFAYLTLRGVDGQPDRYEFGAYGHGPEAGHLAEQLAEQVRVWDRDLRRGPDARICLYPAGTAVAQPRRGRIVEKHHTTVTISWS